MIVFLDGPALLACYAECAETLAIRRIVKREERLAVAAHADLELTALLHRLFQRGARRADLGRVLARYQADSRGFLRVPGDPRMPEAAVLLARHGLTSGQAADLAAALELARRLREQVPTLDSSPVIFLCLAPRLREAARAEGLQTL